MKRLLWVFKPKLLVISDSHCCSARRAPGHHHLSLSTVCRSCVDWSDHLGFSATVKVGSPLLGTTYCGPGALPSPVPQQPVRAEPLE